MGKLDIDSLPTLRNRLKWAAFHGTTHPATAALLLEARERIIQREKELASACAGTLPPNYFQQLDAFEASKKKEQA